MTSNSLPQRPWLNQALESTEFMVCRNCNGTGGDPNYHALNLKLYHAQISWNRPRDNIILFCCNKCYGKGYIDWIKNIRGKQMEGYDKYFIDPKWNSVEFLISALTGPNDSYEIGMYFNIFDEIWEIEEQFLDVEQGLTNFNEYKFLIRKYLGKAHRKVLNNSINLALVLNGKVCTKCFRIVPDEILIDRIKRTCSLIPALPDDKINYDALYRPDKYFPLFRLCDVCAENISQSEIKQLKMNAFKQENTGEFSDQYIHKIYSLTDFSEVHI